MQTKQLWIMRHGEAHRMSHNHQDSQRELTEHGIAQAKHQAQFLQNIDFDNIEVWSSPYVRTQQTTQQVLATLNQYEQHISLKPEFVPHGQVDLCLPMIDGYFDNTQTKQLLIVSHQPLVNALVSLLCTASDTSNEIPFMQPSALVCIESESWLAGWATLKSFHQAPELH